MPGTPKPRANACEQLVEVERLPHVVVRAGFEARDDVTLAPPGQHKHRQLASASTKLLQHVEPVSVGKPHVEDQQVELVGQAEPFRLLAVVHEERREPARP